MGVCVAVVSLYRNYEGSIQPHGTPLGMHVRACAHALSLPPAQLLLLTWGGYTLYFVCEPN